MGRNNVKDHTGCSISKVPKERVEPTAPPKHPKQLLIKKLQGSWIWIWRDGWVEIMWRIIGLIISQGSPDWSLVTPDWLQMIKTIQISDWSNSHPFISSSQLPDSQLMKDLTSFFESFSRCLNFPLYLILPFDLVHSANCWLREEATIYLSRSDLNSLHWFLNLIFIRKTNYEFLHNHSLKVPATSITFHFASKIIYLCWNIRNQE